MRLRIGPGKDEAMLVLEGELDLASSEQLLAAIELCAVPGDTLTLDVANLTFIDAAGVRALVAVADRLPEGGRLILEGPRGIVGRVLDMLRADRYLRVEIRR
jgi:anti-anti-sigma factor